ncbi:hypothetical protein D9619_004508 [Psilocybe cf. subviscida]|uniref:Aminopeptidase n=1 Tax=Psilocybe cf. subviscida TaxID=2480587 RepID=A0A8H5BPB9_9AGAR|nr:hypothetical protein D9619_004508 [Psilocybe cf. subviscida]
MAETLPAQTSNRLPTTVRPTHYDLTLKTDIHASSFQGVLKIELSIIEESREIVLHSANLLILNASIKTSESDEKHDLSPRFDDKRDFLIFDPPNVLKPASKAELRVAFSADMSSSLMGYFKSSYQSREGKQEYCAITQFEPTAARHVFPCWDEPLFKASFAITMISRSDTVSLSNMSAQSEDIIVEKGLVPPEIDIPGDGEWKMTRFDATPPMSTYIVAFANGRFEYLESSVVMPLSGKTLPLRVYTTPDVLHQAQFALDVKAAALPIFERSFDVEYPLPKLDTVIVADFDGAMENWGLIIGNRSSLLFDPERPSDLSKRQVVTTQCHEIAHMWFGNITTMKWWDNLYLNEGFATIIGNVLVPDKSVLKVRRIMSLLINPRRLFPHFGLVPDFVSLSMERGLSVDSRISSHPVEVPDLDINDITQIFDILSYSKAGAVLRMLYVYVGEALFFKGVSLYLKKHLFGSTVTQDLWEGMASATGLDIAHLMENWVNKTGYPVLTVTEQDEKILTVRQDRFLETGPASSEQNETIWTVPLAIASSTNGDKTIESTIILEERAKSIAFDTTKSFKLNAETTGFYRVLYSPDRWEKIAKDATQNDSIFTLNDRIGLAQDVFALARAGLLKLSIALSLVLLWKHEKEYFVWRVVGANVTMLLSVWWENPSIVDRLNELRRILFTPLVSKYGYHYPASEATDVSLLRTLAIEQAASAGESGVVNELKSRFKHYVDTGDDTQIPGNLQRIIYITAAKHGGREEYAALTKMYEQPRTQTEKEAARAGMASSQHSSLLQETLVYVRDRARVSDVSAFYSALAANFNGRRLLTHFVKDNYDTIYNRLEDSWRLGAAVTVGFSSYSSQEDCAATKVFFETKDTSKYAKSVAQALDRIQAKVMYIERSTTDLVQWLQENTTV